MTHISDFLKHPRNNMPEKQTGPLSTTLRNTGQWRCNHGDIRKACLKDTRSIRFLGGQYLQIFSFPQVCLDSSVTSGAASLAGFLPGDCPAKHSQDVGFVRAADTSRRYAFLFSGILWRIVRFDTLRKSKNTFDAMPQTTVSKSVVLLQPVSEF